MPARAEAFSIERRPSRTREKSISSPPSERLFASPSALPSARPSASPSALVARRISLSIVRSFIVHHRPAARKAAQRLLLPEQKLEKNVVEAIDAPFVQLLPGQLFRYGSYESRRRAKRIRHIFVFIFSSNVPASREIAAFPCHASRLVTARIGAEKSQRGRGGNRRGAQKKTPPSRGASSLKRCCLLKACLLLRVKPSSSTGTPPQGPVPVRRSPRRSRRRSWTSCRSRRPWSR